MDAASVSPGHPLAGQACRLLRCVLGGLFLWAGVLKYLDLRGFAAVISRYGLVPEELLAAVALTLPALEILAGAGVLLGLRGALALMLALLLLFIGVLWFGILHDLEVDCGCFSLSEQREHGSLWSAFFRDWLMVGAVACLWLMQRRSRRLRGGGPPNNLQGGNRT